MPSIVDHCIQAPEMTTITNSIEVFDKYKQTDEKDSDEESFHLPLDDDDAETKSQGSVKNTSETIENEEFNGKISEGEEEEAKNCEKNDEEQQNGEDKMDTSEKNGETIENEELKTKEGGNEEEENKNGENKDKEKKEEAMETENEEKNENSDDGAEALFDISIIRDVDQDNAESAAAEAVQCQETEEEKTVGNIEYEEDVDGDNKSDEQSINNEDVDIIEDGKDENNDLVPTSPQQNCEKMDCSSSEPKKQEEETNKIDEKETVSVNNNNNKGASCENVVDITEIKEDEENTKENVDKEDQIPKNTKKSQTSVWNQFEQFCQSRNFSIELQQTPKKLNDILKDFALNMKRNDGKDYKESVIKTMFNVTAKQLQELYWKKFNCLINPLSDIQFKGARTARDTKRRLLQSDLNSKSKINCLEIFINEKKSKIFNKKIMTDTIPINTKKSHISVWHQFQQFCQSRNFDVENQQTPEKLNDILKDYALNMKRNDGKDYKESVIKTMFNVTAKQLQELYWKKFKCAINPLTDRKFRGARAARDEKRRLLQFHLNNKRKTEKKSEIIDKLDENNPTGLQIKFFQIVAKDLGWLKNGDDASSCCIYHFSEELNVDGIPTGRIRYNPMFSKIFCQGQGYYDINDSKWIVKNLENLDCCPVRILKILLSKRSVNITIDNLFLTPNPFWEKNGADWYNNCPIDKNVIKKWIKINEEKNGENVKILIKSEINEDFSTINSTEEDLNIFFGESNSANNNNTNIKTEKKSLKRTVEETSDISSEEDKNGRLKRTRIESPSNEITNLDPPTVTTNTTNSSTTQKSKNKLCSMLSLAEFMKSKKISTKRLTVNDLEEFCIQKLCEVLLNRSDLGFINDQLKQQEQLIDQMRKEIQQLTKQARDLEVVNKRLMNDLKNQSITQKPLNPLKITRSVGLQVKFAPPPTSIDNNNKKRILQPGQKIQNLTTPLPPLTPVKNVNRVATSTPVTTRQSVKSQQATAKPAVGPILSNTLQTRRTTETIKNLPPTLKSSPKTPVEKSSPTPTATNSVIDLTDEDDKKNGATLVNLRTTPIRLNTSTGQSIRLATSPNVKGSTVTTTTPQLMYVVQSNPQNVLTSGIGPKTVLVNFQSPNGVITSALNGSAVSVLPKQVQLKPVTTRASVTPTPTPNSMGKIVKVATNKHPAPLPAPPIVRVNTDKTLKPIPPKPHLTIRKTDTGIILQWRMPYELDMYEVIASYQLYAYQETNQTPSTDMWRKVGDVKALALPMACTLTQFADKNTYYFAVRPVDIHKRIGLFSEPEEISL